MRRRTVGLVAGIGALVLVVGCAGGSGTSESSGSSLWPDGAAVSLDPTGWTLFGGAEEGEVVVDGAGMAWVDGPWQVARVDPTTGDATIWDAADDLAFASVTGLSPAQPEGAWLISTDRARLFDGERFVVELAIPEQYREGPDGEGPEMDLLQVGDEVWVSGVGGVGRWADGAWSPVGPDQVTRAGPLALDSPGSVWAGSVTSPSRGNRGAPVRFDGQAWSTPDAAAAPGGDIRDIAADPSGGVWLLSAQEATEDHGVFRFDGTTWRKVGSGGYGGELSVTSSGAVWAMVSAGNGVDPSGEASVARLEQDGTWKPYGADEGAPSSGEFGSASLAVAGDTVLVTGIDGMVRSEGERFVPLWTDPMASIKPAFGIQPGGLLAISQDEVWMQGDPDPEHIGLPVESTLARNREGRWESIGPSLAGDMPGAPALATDGAIWEVTPSGLIRIDRAQGAGDEWSVIAEDIANYSTHAVAAGQDGSVWTTRDGSVVNVTPDGSRASIGRPRGVAKLPEAGPLASQGPVVWVAGTQQLHRWDGDWASIPLPESNTGVSAMMLAPDGALWAVMVQEDGPVTLARYPDATSTDGVWTVEVGDVRGLAAGPDGSVCTLRRAEADVACFDEAMAVVSSTPVGGWAQALSAAADASTWVLGEQVARVPSPS